MYSERNAVQRQHCLIVICLYDPTSFSSRIFLWSLSYPFCKIRIYSFNRYLVNTYCVPGIVLSSKNCTPTHFLWRLNDLINCWHMVSVHLMLLFTTVSIFYPLCSSFLLSTQMLLEIFCISATMIGMYNTVVYKTPTLPLRSSVL